MDQTWNSSDARPPLTPEMIRQALERARAAAPEMRTYAGYYWIVPRHWHQLFSKN